MRERTPLPSPLLFIADASLAADPALQVAEAVAAGASFIEVRRVRAGDGAPESALRLDEIRRILAAAGTARVIVNDRVDLAVLSGAAGAHVGQDDLPAHAARRILGPERLLGLSTHDAVQFSAAQDLPLDYVALGPIFASTTKSGHAQPLGLERLAACAATARLPVVAIGGIDASRLAGVLDAGADCVAIASAISSGPVGPSVTRVLEILREHRRFSPPQPGGECIVIAGPPGAGKSRVGELVAARLGLPFTDLDERLDSETLLPRVGEATFRLAEASALREILQSGARRIVALGGGTPLGDWSRLLLRVSRAHVVVLDVDPEVCAGRLARDGRGRPLAEASRADGPDGLRGHLSGRLDAARSLPGARPVDGSGSPEAVAEWVARVLAGAMP